MIAERDVPLRPETLAIADDASKELTRFDAEAGSFAAPFAAILLRTESASSSEVEHLTASAKQVALAELDRSDSPNAQLVVANVRAMQAAIALADRLDEQAIIAMHEALLEASAPHFVGGWRDQQVWIGGGSFSPHHATFVPPHHDRVPKLMADLVRFADRTDVPALAHAAIAHAQFETIHPFPDGNGRTGRALLHGMLRAADVTRNVAVPVSAGLLGDLDAYFLALTRYRQGQPDVIVETVAEAAFRAVANGRALVRELQEIAAAWDALVRARSDASVHRVKAHLLQHPLVTAASVAEARRCERGRGADLDRQARGGGRAHPGRRRCALPGVAGDRGARRARRVRRSRASRQMVRGRVDRLRPTMKYDSGPMKFTAMSTAHTAFGPRTSAAGRRARSVHAVAASARLTDPATSVHVFC